VGATKFKSSLELIDKLEREVEKNVNLLRSEGNVTGRIAT
jgi:hypothetical protein